MSIPCQHCSAPGQEVYHTGPCPLTSTLRVEAFPPEAGALLDTSYAGSRAEPRVTTPLSALRYVLIVPGRLATEGDLKPVAQWADGERTFLCLPAGSSLSAFNPVTGELVWTLKG